MANERMPAGADGSFVVMFGLLLFFLVASLGLAIDVAQVYSRQSELQAIADSAALAAAAPLDGTAQGVTTALARARAVTEANRYGYGKLVPGWSDAALQFAASQDGPWLSPATAAAAGLRYARVDTGGLASAPGRVDTIVLALLAGAEHTLLTSARAVAGPRFINLAPLAICAMKPAPAASQARGSLHELVEYGFRRGVGYNLLSLNPGASTPVSYLVNPLAAPPLAPRPDALAPGVLRAFMCSGTLALPALPAGLGLYVAPIAAGQFAYAEQLNSRFDLYPGAQPCSQVSAPPDVNIQQYLPSGPSWMASTPDGTSAANASDRPPLQTVADLPAATAQTSAASYGPLWAYGPAARFDGGAFGTADWSELYPVPAGAAAVATSAAYPYPLTSTPYSRGAGAFLTRPAAGHTGQARRRVLLVPLLQCPPAQPAQVLAVGRFFMTAAASATALSGEFAGLAGAAELAGPVGLVQ